MINCTSKIKQVKKVFNFLVIEFLKQQNTLINISNQKEKLVIQNIYKYFLNFKKQCKNNIILNLNNQILNSDNFCKKANKINIFCEKFAILHQKINKKCNFTANINNFKHKHEIINLFLKNTDWINDNYNLILDYVYSLSDYNLKEVVNNNLSIIANNCKNLNIKNALTDQLGQLLNTVMDYVLSGNFEILNNASDFYFCYLYLIFYEELLINQGINAYNKKYLQFFSELVLKINNKRIYYQIVSSNNKRFEVSNINYFGFDYIKSYENKCIIYI